MSFFDDDDDRDVRDTISDDAEPGDDRPRRGRPRPGSRSRRGLGSGSRGPRSPRPPGGGGGAGAMMQQPAARLLAVVAAVIILIVVLSLVVRDCRRSQVVDSYRSYVVQGVTPIAAKSTEEGKQLLTLLANSKGAKAVDIQEGVRAIGRQASALVDQAQSLDAPEKLGDAHRSLVLSLQYRVNGINSLAAEIPNAVKSTDRADAAAKLATPMGRILASDFLYSDSFVGPARKALDDDNVDGVEVPESAILAGTAHAGKAGPGGARNLLADLKRGAPAATAPGGTPSSGGLHGTGIVSVKVLPSNKQLVNTAVNEVVGSADNEWEVTIENGGDSVENGIVITATLTPGTGAPLVSRGTIDTIDQGETKSVAIPVGNDLPPFGENAELTISVAPVPEETRTSNNTGKYTVKFTLQ